MSTPVTGSARTTRLRKLECDSGCGYIVRVSRAAMLRGLPTCGARLEDGSRCGGTLWPSTLEDAEACLAAGVLSSGDLAVHPERCEYTRQLSSILHGQAAHVQRGRKTRQPEALAHERLVRDRIDLSRAAQLAALAQYRPGARPVEPMPF